ncbi:MAG: response regulator [Gammaproteobacteria bacterium]|nr:response regulator [Gammaproteobacteria bacterium]
MTDRSRTTPINVLLVEDSPSDQELTREAFASAKVLNDLYVVDNGMDALDYVFKRNAFASATRPDIILLDLNLPGMDGREVLGHIKSDPELRMIPVIVLTTSDDEHDILRMYDLHANCYITKPVDFRKFVEAIKVLEDFWMVLVKLPGGRFD